MKVSTKAKDLAIKGKLVETGLRPWLTKLIEFDKFLSSHPTWTIKQFADHLNTTPRSIFRMQKVSKHLDDIRISNSTTFNQAYEKTKILYPTYRNSQNQITSITSQILDQ